MHVYSYVYAHLQRDPSRSPHMHVYSYVYAHLQRDPSRSPQAQHMDICRVDAHTRRPLI